MVSRSLFALLNAFLLCGQPLAKLLVDYTAPSAVAELGSCQLEGAELGDHISCPGNDDIFIKPGQDSSGKAALHFHRNPSNRRAEVKASGNYAEGQKYFVGYEFQLSNIHQHLAIFQWKRADSSEVQNIPFNLQFTEVENTRLSLGYTPPGSKYKTIWTDPNPFSTGKTHNIALAWDTIAGSKANAIQMWLDGQPVFKQSGLDLWTSDTYPKFGIYRGEKGDHDDGEHSDTFDSYIYRVQVSDASLDEVSAASGLSNSTKRSIEFMA